MPKSSYDVVIAGTDLPALVFGALAAKKGYRVLVLGHGGKENVYDVEGFHFVRRPHLLFGFSDSAPIREVFRELALAAEMRNLPRPMTPSCGVVLPDARIEVTHLKGVLEAEIAREFPKESSTFSEALQRLTEVEPLLEPTLQECPSLPPKGIREYFTFRRHRKVISALDKVDFFEPLKMSQRAWAFVSALVRPLSGLSAVEERKVPLIRLLSHVLRGLHEVEWGLDTLKSLFLNRIRDNSGDVRLGDSVDMILVKRGRVREVEIRARDETIGVGLFVAGTRLAALLDLIPEGQAKKRYRARVERHTPSHLWVTLNVGARRDLIPEAMPRTTFVVSDPGKPLEGANLLVVQVDPAMEPVDSLDPNLTTVAISAPLEAMAFDGTVSSIDRFCDQIFTSAKRLLPFIEEHKIVLSPSAIGIDPQTGARVIDPAGLFEVYSSPVKRSLDLMTWPIRTDYKNLYFLGDAVAGALGFEGAFFAAQMALNLLKRLIPLKSVV